MTAPTDSERLRELVAECLGRIEDGETDAVDTACRQHPGLAERLRERMDQLGRIGLVGVSADEFPERLGEFRLKRRLGGGGMGVVFLAEQEPLGREVALKIIRHDFLYFAQARERFRREVETVARLQHPGIVPIHTVGEENGVPFFTMERVRGCTLEEALRDLSGRDPHELDGEDMARAVVRCTPDPGPDAGLAQAGSLFQGSWPETCFRMAQSVADALQHVHEHDILHRDLKPSNIMITPTGRVMLVDFGLASQSSSSNLTATGSLLGSLPYMPPELLEGDASALDVRADIYSLGATLYELLTLRSPYRSSSPEQTRKNILRGEPRPVRQLNSAVSWEMETVCVTALERDRERRYSSTVELAQDLGSALQARPLLARRPGPWLRARRYLQRHPTASAAALVAFLLLTMAALLFAAFERDARQLVNVQREHAWQNLADARDAVDQMLKRVSEGVLSQTPYMEDVRRELLEDALVFYRKFLKRHGDVPELRFEAAKTWRSMGLVQTHLGRTAPAREAYESAISTFEALGALFPDESTYRVDHAATMRELASLLTSSAIEFDVAEDLLQSALRVELDLLETHGRSSSLVVEVAMTRSKLATLYRRMELLPQAEREARTAVNLLAEIEVDERPVLEARALATGTLAAMLGARKQYREARASYERCQDLQKQLIDLEGVTVERRAELARTQLQLTEILLSSKVLEGAEAACKQTLDTYRDLVGDFPRVPEFRIQMASSLFRLASLHTSTGDHDDAEAALREAQGIYSALHEQFPDQIDYHNLLAASHSQLGVFFAGRGRHAEGEAAIEASLALRDEIMASNPEVPQYAMAKSRELNQWAVMHHEAERVEQAEETYLAALAIVEELADKYPETPEFASECARLCTNLGILMADCEPKRIDRAERYYNEAVERMRGLVGRYTQNVAYRAGLARSRTSLGILYEDHGRYAEAELEYRKVLAERQNLLQLTPDDPEALHELGGAEHNVGSVLERMKKWKDALRYLQLGAQHQQAALAINPEHPWYRRYLRINFKLIASIELSLERHEDAARSADQYTVTIPEEAGTHAVAAEFYARCAALAQRATRVEADRQAQLAERYAEKAVAALERAQELGFPADKRPLDSDVWTPLHGREDFERVRAAIEQTAKKNTPSK